MMANICKAGHDYRVPYETSYKRQKEKPEGDGRTVRASSVPSVSRKEMRVSRERGRV
jgi:hypothetical protein